MIVYRARLQTKRWPLQLRANAPNSIHPALVEAHRCLDAYHRAIEVQSLPTLRTDERLIPVAVDKRPYVPWLFSPNTFGMTEAEFSDAKSWSYYDTAQVFTSSDEKRKAIGAIVVMDMTLRSLSLGHIISQADTALLNLYKAWGNLEAQWPDVSEGYRRSMGRSFREDNLPTRDRIWEQMMVWCERIESVQLPDPVPGVPARRNADDVTGTDMRRGSILKKAIEELSAQRDKGGITPREFSLASKLLFHEDTDVMEWLLDRFRAHWAEN